MRHRCHISCEIHDHHLNDAMRLHQAMLSNAALDIGSINLADMDPDEIQVSKVVCASYFVCLFIYLFTPLHADVKKNFIQQST